MDKFSLVGKTVLITGASSGFGHHFAGVVADAGANVVLGARRIDKIESRVQELVAKGANVLGVPLDVNDPDSAAAFLGAAETEFSLVRFKGHHSGADAVYQGYETLSAEDVADAVMYIATRPPHVSIQDVLIMPAAQASAYHLHKS